MDIINIFYLSNKDCINCVMVKDTQNFLIKAQHSDDDSEIKKGKENDLISDIHTFKDNNLFKNENENENINITIER